MRGKISSCRLRRHVFDLRVCEKSGAQPVNLDGRSVFKYDQPGFDEIRKNLQHVPFAKLDSESFAGMYEIRAILGDLHIRYSEAQGTM